MEDNTTRTWNIIKVPIKSVNGTENNVFLMLKEGWLVIPVPGNVRRFLVFLIMVNNNGDVNWVINGFY